jgi:hypothetical protein
VRLAKYSGSRVVTNAVNGERPGAATRCEPVRRGHALPAQHADTTNSAGSMEGTAYTGRNVMVGLTRIPKRSGDLHGVVC